ncbi:MAG: transcription antitermination factor NusB, partial [Campylobacter sp.]|nr:transcription antitermination factor NusB [Campylobacter sp.]
MATRHQVRQAVITLLYTHEMDTFNEDFASEYFAEQKIKNEQKNFAEALFGGVLENIDNIDEKINSYLSSFKLAELGAMERAILRLGAHEILAQTCEARVAISEAVALASEFGSTNGVKLVNGVLDNIAKDKSPVESAAVDTKE